MLETSTTENQTPVQTRFNPWNPLESLRRCCWWSLPVGIVLAYIAAFASMRIFEPNYRASCLLTPGDYLLLRDPIPAHPFVLNKERAILSSASVIDPILADPTLRTAPSLSDPNHAENNLRQRLSVDLDGKWGYMTVGYKDTNPDAAAMICNAIVDSYLRQRDAFRDVRTTNLVRPIKTEIQRWQQEVEQRQIRVQELGKQLPGQSLGDLATAAENESGENVLAQLRFRIIEMNVRIAMLDFQLTLNDPIAEPHSAEEESQPDPNQAGSTPEMKLSFERLERLAIELDGLNQKYSDERSRLERFGGATAEMQFAVDDVSIAVEVVYKLREWVAAIITEIYYDDNVGILVRATPPREPINSPYKRTAVLSGVAFLSPLMLGFLLGFKRES